MSKIKDFLEKFRPERLVSTVSIFPEIDSNKIASDLNVIEKGNQRGIENLPKTDDESLDPVESEIVEEINRLRAMGINRFEEHMETYARRLREVGNSKAELRTLAETAITDYQTSIAIHREALANHRERVMGRFLELKWFIADNGLRRTAHDRKNIFFTCSLILFMVLIESVMNGYFFAAGHEYGLIGGTMFAIIISVINVGFSLVAGIYSHYVNHIKAHKKIFGIAVILSIVAGGIIFNLFVAHFRDSISRSQGDWRQALAYGVETFSSNMFLLGNIETWLLFLVGMLICIIAFWKGYTFFDPYPDYDRIYHRWESARDQYAHGVESARRALEDLRDAATLDLQDARNMLTSSIYEAMDVIYARAGLERQLSMFMEQAELAVNTLLSKYRDANRQKRTTNPPSHFNNKYSFNATNIPEVTSLPPREGAEKEIESINSIVEDTITKIFGRYEEAISSYETIEDLEIKAISLPSSAVLNESATKNSP